MSDSKTGEIDRKKEETSVLTVRISKELDQILENIKNTKGITKANVIRNYLEMAKYMIIDQDSIRSIDDRDLISIKKSTFRKLLNTLKEETQMEWGLKFARFINDIARLQGQFMEGLKNLL